eukprot:TRINITY_DN1287_c0_g1_i1.p1 TRINITY_DN1287_c0_g1~~TRINITY_DN1287_c0_g1_i1.p1  ORF type:complete len:762 (+),score=198.35 TRINITY_DN1287_c0_g1_i1:83-2368(+)
MVAMASPRGVGAEFAERQLYVSGSASLLSMPSSSSLMNESVSPSSSATSATSYSAVKGVRHVDPCSGAQSGDHFASSASLCSAQSDATADDSTEPDSQPASQQPPVNAQFNRPWVALPLGWVWDPVQKRSVRSRQAPLSASRHRGLQNPLPRGGTGLANIGNTCFMNSALQCLSHTALLHTYFAGDHYVHDVALGNFNGKDGAVATAFSQLLKHLWCGEYRAFAPREFKQNVSGFFEFAMHQQHDAQEFLLFLLDGLHEDVNKASGGKPDAAKAAPAAEAGAVQPPLSKQQRRAKEFQDAAASWDRHLARNRSTVNDLFYGQYKSKMQCNVCRHESVSHDPMLFLQVPVFTEAMVWQYVPVMFYPLDRLSPPVRYQFKVKRSGSVSQVVRDLQQALGTHSNCLTLHLFVWDDCWVPLHHEMTFEQLRLRNTAFSVFEHLPIPKVIPPKVGVKPTECEDVLVKVTHWVSPGGADLEITDEYSLVRGTRGMTNAELYQCARDAVGGGAGLTGLASDEGYDDDQFLSDSAQEHDLAALFDTACRRQQDASGHRREHHIIRPKLVTLHAEWRAWTPRPPPVSDASMEASTALDNAKDLTLADCLRRHTTTEQLDEQNAWTCPECKVPQCAFKTLSLWRLPKYLIVHQKKLFFTGGSGHKIDTNVDYPVRGFDVRPFLDGNVRDTVANTTYDLYAAVMHYGSATYGHCTALAYHRDAARWMAYDDDGVTFADDSEIKDTNAYVLFYELRDEHSPFTGADGSVTSSV